MKKITTLLLMLLLVATAANAKFAYWGYCDKDIVGAYGSSAYGKAAIYIPAEVAQLYKGCQLTGVRVGLAAQASKLSVFATTDLNATPFAQKVSDKANKGNNIVKFDAAYTITGEGFYIGYEVSGLDACIGYVANKTAYSNYTDFGNGWVDNAANGANALSLTARIEADNLPVDLSVMGLRDIATKENEPFNVSAKVVNLSATKLYSYRIGYSVDGGEEQFVDFEETLGDRSENVFSFTHPGIKTKGTHKLKVRVVVDEDVNPANDATECNVLMTSIATTKRVLMEEATGIYCGNCPRGIVSIEKCKEKYPDNFIAIAKHAYDGTPSELLCPSYEYANWGVYPQAALDRRATFDPVLSTTFQYMDAILEKSPAIAGIETQANYVAGDYTHINVNTNVQFVKDMTNCSFGIAYAIIEDGVTGYQQNNGYANGKFGELDGWENKPSMATVTLNHVARAGFGIVGGIENSIPVNDVYSTTIYNHNTVLNVPSNVQNRKNIKVVAFLINRGDHGYVENAVEVPVLEAGETSIADITSTPAPDLSLRNGSIVADGFNGKLQVYTVGGQLVKNASLARGMYIVRGTDGKQSFVKKISL